MALVYLATTTQVTDYAPSANANYNWFRNAVRNDCFKKHSVTDSLPNADIILFIGSRCLFYSDIIHSKVFKQYAEKCFVLDTLDYTIPRIPGLYARVPRYLHSVPLYQYGFYPKLIELESRRNGNNLPQTPTNLFSFVGAVSTCPEIRQRIISLKHCRSILIDTDKQQRIQYAEYLKIIQQSKFILCPRGVGPSSHRYFEAMRIGKVPVIIADEWTDPRPLNGKFFSIHVPEREIETIPDLLEELEMEAEEMGIRAKQVYETNFSANSCFHWTVERCLDIKQVSPDHYTTVKRNILPECLWETSRSLFMNALNGRFNKRDVRNLGSLIKELYKANTRQL